MNLLLPLLVFLIPVCGLVSGLSAAFFVPIFALTTSYASWFINKDKSTDNKSILTSKDTKAVLLFLGWLGISCLWSTSPRASMIAFTKIFVMAMLSIFACINAYNLKQYITRLEKSVIFGVIVSLVLFFLELWSDGFLSSTFRFLFKPSGKQEFMLHFLDRGCAILALTSWLVIGILLKYKNTFFAVGYYFLITITLIFSDSLAGSVGFSAAGFVFLMTRYFSFFRNPKTLSAIFIFSAILMIILSIAMEPRSLSDKASSLPISAKHRLFIWNFVADKAIEHPVVGSGFFASKLTSMKENSFAEYEGNLLPLFPLHPHNNILQIFFETGIVGLSLFILLGCKYLFYIGKNYHINDSSGLNLISVCYACFATYMIIGMISYSMWQSWWVCIMLWITIMFCLVLPIKKRE
jgi:O-antigen ligase